jgi:hypothetical protein
MGKPSVEQVLAGIEKETVAVGRFRPERNFLRAMEKVREAYLLQFDPDYAEPQAIWFRAKSAGLVEISHAWSDRKISTEEMI